MSRLVDRLEQAGLLRRESAPEDARGAYAILTQKGQEHQTAAEARNVELVREHFLSLYSEAELEQMGAFWMRFLNHEPGK
jgi:DNA-binding MarR family transcriptional regulator